MYCVYEYVTLYYGLLIKFIDFNEELNILCPSENIFFFNYEVKNETGETCCR